jgi:ComEC/Rec2-related protein
LGNFVRFRLLWLLPVCSVWAAVALLSPHLRRPALALLIICFAWANTVSRTTIISPVDLRNLVGDSPEYLTLCGTLVDMPVYREYERNHRISGHTSAQINVRAIVRDSVRQPAVGWVAVSTRGQLDGRFFSGRQVEVTGVLQRPKGPNAPGQFDYLAYLYYQSVFFQLRAENTNDWRIPDLNPGKFPIKLPICDRFSAWAQRTLAKGMPVEDESLRLLWAMVLGWKPALTQEVAEPFMQSGTLHIFAISGLHIALISGILVSVLRVLRVPRAACGLLVIPIIWFYTLATGWQASAIRSTVMMSIIILGWALERPSNLLNSLAAAGFIILVWDPLQLFQASFQLSFFVVLGLALIVPPFERIRQKLLAPDPFLPPELRPRWKRWLDTPIRVVTTSLVTSLAAWVGSMPLIAYYFFMITPGSLLANLVIVPLSSVALMSSLGSLVCGDWLPFLTVLFNHSSWFWMQLMIWASEWFAAMPGGYFYVRPPGFAEFVIYYLLLGGLLTGVFLKPRWRIWAAAISVLLLASWIVHWALHLNEVHLTVLPLRAGSIFVKAFRSGDNILADCGDAASAESMVKPFLRSQGMNGLPTLLLTHGDLYHVGGLETVASRFPIGIIVTSPVRFRSPAYRDILAKLERSPQHWRRVQRADQVHSWTVLHPSDDDRFAQAVNNALVLRSEFYGTRVLLLSKLGRLGQRTLIQREVDLHADILIAGLPNLTDALSPALIEAVRPKLIIVASGDYPASARPNGQLRERLNRAKIPVLYTADCGAVTITLRRAGFEIATMGGQRFSPANLPAIISPQPTESANDSNAPSGGDEP